MGILLPQEVEIKLRGGTITKYEEKGYIIPRYIDKDNISRVKRNSTLKISILDLSASSHIKVKAVCDCCGETFEVAYRDALNSYCVSKINKMFCKKCYRQEMPKYHINTESIWSDRKYALEQVDNFIKTYGTLKGMTVNNTEGNRIHTSLKSHKYDMEDLCTELGYDYLELKQLYYPEGYLDSFENFKKEVQKFIDNYGYFPTLQHFKRDLHIPLSVVIKHGNMSELQKKIMGNNNNLLEDDRGFYNRSHYEYMVAQFLIHNNVDYLREQFPFPKPNNMLRSDFTFYGLSNEVYQVEIWGYFEDDNVSSRSNQYNIRRKEKEKLYKDNSINLISINPNTFNSSLDIIQEKLFDIFQPYIKLGLSKIAIKYMINPNKLSDEELLARFMEYSEDDMHLPKQEIIQRNEPTLFNEMIRRYGNQNSFAKEHNKLTYSKVGLWDIDLALRIFNHMHETYGYVLSTNEMRDNGLIKTDNMLIGFKNGIQKVFGNTADGYLYYYNYCIENKLKLHDKDLSYLKNLSVGHYFNGLTATPERKSKALEILNIYFKESEVA